MYLATLVLSVIENPTIQSWVVVEIAEGNQGISDIF